MAAPLRKQRTPASSEPQFKIRSENKKLDLDAANNNESNEQFEDAFLRDFPRFTANRSDVRALAAVRRKFKLGRYHDLNIFVLAHDRDVSAERVFGRDEENKVVFYSTSKAIKRALEARGHEARKADLEQHAESGRADIFIMLDPEISVTKRLRANIVPRGLVLCRLKNANSLRAYGYSFRAIVDMNGGTPSLSRHDDPTFWKSVEVDSEGAFREASSEQNEGVVTYEQAKEKVREAREAGIPGMSENDVFESYSTLIEMAEEQNRGALERGETMLSLTAKVGEKEVTISGINVVLPTKKSGHDDDIVVMRKGLM
ncbi:hypothetical protein HYW60_03710 [Candidatus Kaiserbacteria bacterium]|nr:hypothetical protein [Candidatus Kaiserbacteria bacterium]